MLKKDKLKQEIQSAIEDILPPALEQGMKHTFPRNTKSGDTSAQNFAETVTKLLAEPLASALAAAIDYHVRSAEIYGTVITVGSPSSQVARINSPSPLTNGKVPNSLGIK